MLSLRISRLALSLSALPCTLLSAQNEPQFTSPLPTGVRLDPAGPLAAKARSDSKKRWLRPGAIE